MRRLLARLGRARRRQTGRGPPAAAEPGDAAARVAPRPEIRPAVARDLPAVAAIERLSFQNPWSREALRQELENPGGRLLVAAPPGRPPVGYAILRLLAGEGELLSLAVHPDERRRGLGRALLEAVCQRARAAQARSLYLEVRVTNRAARDLYRRCGFLEVGRRRAYYADGTDALVMRLDL